MLERGNSRTSKSKKAAHEEKNLKCERNRARERETKKNHRKNKIKAEFQHRLDVKEVLGLEN